MAYSRSTKGAFQLWADTVGDQSYTWDNVLPYYRRSMNFTPPNAMTRFANATPSYDAAATAQGGPLDITYSAYAESWSTWVARGLAAIGMPGTGALLDGALNGSTWQLYTVDPSTGHRASSATNFLRPALSRPNLFVFTETMAERILFNSNATATGVTVTSGNSTFGITATKEVILSAGVFQSPQLLMVSGVGPRAVLEQHDIPVIADRPGVGQGMLDHMLIPLTYRVNLASIDTTSAEFVREFDTLGTGPVTNAGNDFIGLEKIPASFRANWSSETCNILDALPADWPEVEYLVLPTAVTGGTLPGAAYGTIFTALQAPQSTGNVSITSASMRDAPLINPNWLTAQADLDILVAAFRRVRQMAASEAMAGIIIGDEVLPGPSFQTEDSILAYFKFAGTSISHGHATNRMGKASNARAVVCPAGKVYGVKNRRWHPFLVKSVPPPPQGLPLDVHVELTNSSFGSARNRRLDLSLLIAR